MYVYICIKWTDLQSAASFTGGYLADGFSTFELCGPRAYLPTSLAPIALSDFTRGNAVPDIGRKRTMWIFFPTKQPYEGWRYFGNPAGIGNLDDLLYAIVSNDQDHVSEVFK